MKKQLLTLLFTVIAAIGYAQCIPGTQTAPAAGYILPDSATGFAHGCAGMPYTQIIYIKAPKDTSFNYQGAPISATVDSFVVNANIQGLPSGFLVESVPALLAPAPPNPKTNFSRLIIKGDSLACVKISGTIPAGTPPGDINLTVEVRAYVSALGGLVRLDTPANVTYYKITVDAPGTGACNGTSVNEIARGMWDVANIPNPFSNTTTIYFQDAVSEKVTFSVYNLLGMEIFHKTMQTSPGQNQVSYDGSQASPGIYLYRLDNGKQTITRRMVLSH